jgi:saccharopine dehydrogenase-like NADP-dependent oxidoreductase
MLAMDTQVLVFGAGKSATCLIDYLLQEVTANNWELIIADADLLLAQSKIGSSFYAKAIAVDVNNAVQRKALIENATIVISLLPAALHFLVACDCVALGKNLLTASYADDNMRSLEPAIKEKKLLFLCEMGLDPGIDHMSAMQLIHDIKDQQGVVSSFKSHCGGLVAPESDNNPWHYKISWNPRNVVMAGKAGAIYKEDDKIENIEYKDLFDAGKTVEIAGIGTLSYYPNRDSLSYLPLYDLEMAKTFVRTTLRYPDFCSGWKNIIDLKLTDETAAYQTDGMSLQMFFKQHFEKYGFSTWLKKQYNGKFDETNQLLEKLLFLIESEKQTDPAGEQMPKDFLMVDENGLLEDINIDEVKSNAVAAVTGQLHATNLSMQQLFFLGIADNETIINKGYCSAADVLQFALERKLLLAEQDKDMIVMLHEIEYAVTGKQYCIKSQLIVKGEDHLRTAMAKTVGLPIGIAASLILKGKLQLTGLHIPIIPEIYEPVLEELKKHGISFTEKIVAK